MFQRLDSHPHDGSYENRTIFLYTDFFLTHYFHAFLQQAMCGNNCGDWMILLKRCYVEGRCHVYDSAVNYSHLGANVRNVEKIESNSKTCWLILYRGQLSIFQYNLEIYF